MAKSVELWQSLIFLHLIFSYAAILMRPEHRSEIDEKYKKRIEGIIRKPQKTEEPPILTPCPYCETPVAESELQVNSLVYSQNVFRKAKKWRKISIVNIFRHSVCHNSLRIAIILFCQKS